MYTFSGQHINLPSTSVCRYVLLTDGCGRPGPFTYTVSLINERRYNNPTAVYMQTIVINMLNEDDYHILRHIPGIPPVKTAIEIRVSENYFTVNGTEKSLPYERYGVRASKEGKYIKVETKKFTVFFDGIQYLKIRECGSRRCGLCGSKRRTDKIDLQYYSLGFCTDSENSGSHSYSYSESYEIDK